MDHLCFSVLFLLCFCVRLFYVRCGHLLGKDRPLGSRLWCLTVSLSLSHWCSGSGVVPDYINVLIFEPLFTLNNFFC